MYCANCCLQSHKTQYKALNNTQNAIFMTREVAGHVSIVLETIAFFLVTVDLYGKERLLVLRNRIQALEIDEVNKKFEHPFKHGQSVNVFIHALVLTPIFLFVYFSIKYGTFLIANYQTQGLFILIVYMLFIVLLSALIFWKVREVIRVFRYLIKEVILFYIVKALIVITKLFPVEGMMITIGAVLFILSRIIAYKELVL